MRLLNSGVVVVTSYNRTLNASGWYIFPLTIRPDCIANSRSNQKIQLSEDTRLIVLIGLRDRRSAKLQPYVVATQQRVHTHHGEYKQTIRNPFLNG
jgi:hypothetical protein